jgi:hypothetical protein
MNFFKARNENSFDEFEHIKATATFKLNQKLREFKFYNCFDGNTAANPKIKDKKENLFCNKYEFFYFE